MSSSLPSTPITSAPALCIQCGARHLCVCLRRHRCQPSPPPHHYRLCCRLPLSRLSLSPPPQLPLLLSSLPLLSAHRHCCCCPLMPWLSLLPSHPLSFRRLVDCCLADAITNTAASVSSAAALSDCCMCPPPLLPSLPPLLLLLLLLLPLLLLMLC